MKMKQLAAATAILFLLSTLCLAGGKIPPRGWKISDSSAHGTASSVNFGCYPDKTSSVNSARALGRIQISRRNQDQARGFISISADTTICGEPVKYHLRIKADRLEKVPALFGPDYVQEVNIKGIKRQNGRQSRVAFKGRLIIHTAPDTGVIHIVKPEDDLNLAKVVFLIGFETNPF